MYNLPPSAAKPGTPLRELLRLRAEKNTCFVPSSQTIDGYINELLARIGPGKIYSFVSKLNDGRTIAVDNRPMAGGGWVATHDDITEDRQREDTFRLLFDANPVPMWVYDLETLGFLAVNDAATAHYGYSREEFLTLTVRDIRPVEDRARFLTHLAQLDRNNPVHKQWRHRRADGSIFDVTVFSRAMNYGGRRAAIVAIYDETERKQAEDKLRRTSEIPRHRLRSCAGPDPG